MLLRSTILITSLLIFTNADGDIFQSVVIKRDLLLDHLLTQLKSWNREVVKTLADTNQECRRQLLTILDESYNRIFDSWGHIPIGLYNNKYHSRGEYDECVAVNNGTLAGKYCTAYVKVGLAQKEFIRVGICVPEVCDPKFIQLIYSNLHSLSGVYVDHCSKDESTFNKFTYICIVIGGLLLAKISVATIYDYKTRDNLKRNSTLVFWSLRENLKKTFDISTTSADHLNCIDGMRVITMMWIMYYHTYIITYRFHYTDFADDINPQKTNVLVHSGVVGVDTFFVISGFLMTYLSLKKLDKENSLNVGKMVISRYFRLVPSMMAVVFTLNAVTGLVNGPNSVTFTTFNTCMKNWWVNALMMQNYLEGCYPPTWYISSDFIFHILTPILIYGLKRNASNVHMLILVLIAIPLISTFHVFKIYEFEEIMVIMEPYHKDRFEKFYLRPHFRFMTWLIGVTFGYFMYQRDSKPWTLPFLNVVTGWVFALGVLSATLIYPWTQIGIKSIFHAAFYDGFGKIFWALSICVIIFLCEKGHGGMINGFLSNPFWKPLSRLSYSMYIVSFAVTKWNIGNSRISYTLDAKETVQMWWYDFLCSFCIAVVLHVSIELPINQISTMLFKKKYYGEKLKV